MSATGVSLWEVVEARGGPLRESETWAVLAASATSLQDTALSGKVPLGSQGSVVAAAAFWVPRVLWAKACPRLSWLYSRSL